MADVTDAGSEVESLVTGADRQARRLPVAPIVFGVIVAVIAVWVTVATVTDRDPEATVEAFLTAIVEKDVEGAFELVDRYGNGVPYGDTATFLTPEAIDDDWWVVSVAEIDRESSGTARVKAVIAGPGGTAEGEFAVDKIDDEWLLSEPFVPARFPVSPLSYIQINDKIVTRPRRAVNYVNYWLFPGTYRFYQPVPDVVDMPKTEVVAAFPPAGSSSSPDEKVVVPGTLTTGKAVVKQVREQVRNDIDDCAGFATPKPYGNCPFATDGEIDTPDGRRVTDLHSLKWTVKSYPEVAMTDDRTDEYTPGFALRAVTPGAVTLSGSGLDSEREPTTFTVMCDIDLTGLKATVDVDGKVALTLSGRDRGTSNGIFNTCRRNA
jgi:uncharacterized protein YbaA (DUF1428 family)